MMEESAARSSSWLNIFSCILPVLRLELVSALIGTPLVVHTQIIQYFLEKSLHISKDVSYLTVNSSIQIIDEVAEKSPQQQLKVTRQ
jgi:hypothetical protein